MNCLHCGADTTNGLALCQLCQRKAMADLEFLPIYFANLSRWRPGRTGSNRVPGSRVLWDGDTSGSGDRIRDALDHAGNSLTTWARQFADERDVEAPSGLEEAPMVHALAAWFTGHLTSVSTLEWCGEFVRDMSAHEETLRRLTEDVVPGWYAGACRTCGCGTYVVPGLTWVTCGGCGATTYARDHLEVILAEASSWVATPKQLAEAIVALVDGETSVERLRIRISVWGNRGVIESHRRRDRDGDEVGPYRYQLGTILGRLASDGPTEARDALEPAS